MWYIFKLFWVRTVICVLLLVLSLFVMLYAYRAVDKGVWRALLTSVAACVLLSYSSRTLWDLYGKPEGSWVNYTFEPEMNRKSVILSPSLAAIGFKLRKKCKDFIQYYPSVDAPVPEDITVCCLSEEKPITGIRNKTQKLSYFILLWLKQQKMLEAKGQLPIIHRFRDGVYRSQPACVVTSFDGEILSLGQADILSTVVNDKLVARNLSVDGVVLSTSKQLEELRGNKYVLNLPQETPLKMPGLYVQATFMSSDGICIPNLWIEQNFVAYYAESPEQDIIEFCKYQVSTHLNERLSVGTIELSCISLKIEDAGAFTLCCQVTLSESVAEISQELGASAEELNRGEQDGEL